MTVLETFTAPWDLEADLRPRVVAIGGGHGLAACLRAVRSYAGAITAVVSVADNGGSSGRLTAGTGIPPPGDIRRCLLALTPDRSVWSDLFSYRFAGDGEETDVFGHSLGNLILAALTDLEGSFDSAVLAAARLLGAEGRVIPAAQRPLVLSARIGGVEVSGQVAVHGTRGGIESIEVGPAGVTASPSALDAIFQADQIVIGPGSLFTSVIAALAVPGIAHAVNQSSAELVVVLNLITQDAETLGLSGLDHLEALGRHGGLARTGRVIVDGSGLVVPAGLERVVLEKAPGWEVMVAPVAATGSRWPEHDPEALGKALSQEL